MGTRVSVHEIAEFDTTVRTLSYVHFLYLSPSSLATRPGMGPPAGDGAELQFAFAPFHAPELAGLNLVFQILCGLEQRGLKRVVSGLGAQGWAMNQQRSPARMAGRFWVRARARDLQPHLDAGGGFGFPLVFEDHFGGGYRRQAVQAFELILHLAVPGGLGVDAQIPKGGFHIRCRSLSLSHRRAFLLQALEEALEQAAVFFLIGLEFDGEILRDVIFAFASFEDLLVRGD